MRVRKSGSRVIWYECFGFGLILLLSWLNKLIDLPHLLVGGAAHASKWRDSAIETVVILLIWTFVISVTRRLVERLTYLEGLLRLCAWCRKVGHGGKWMRLEDYFAEGLQIGTTHGVCPDCLKKLEEDSRLFARARVQSEAANLTDSSPTPQKSGLLA